MQLDQELQNVSSVAIAGHIRPDGDCVGSCLATYNYITTYYPQVKVCVFLEPIPRIFQFLQGADKILEAKDSEESFDLCIVLDCGDATRLGDAVKFFETAKRTICIDHHVSNQAFADKNKIVADASSASELVYDSMDPAKITKEIAECIYTGMIHDTGVFPSAVYALSCLTNKFGDSFAFLKGITNPISSDMEAVPLSEVTHQYMKSSVAWMSSADASLFTHQ